jgi:hypothetical protein
VATDLAIRSLQPFVIKPNPNLNLNLNSNLNPNPNPNPNPDAISTVASHEVLDSSLNDSSPNPNPNKNKSNNNDGESKSSNNYNYSSSNDSRNDSNEDVNGSGNKSNPAEILDPTVEGIVIGKFLLSSVRVGFRVNNCDSVSVGIRVTYH